MTTPDKPWADHLPEPVEVPVAGGQLPGILTLPPHPAGLVIFAHGSGSSRFSARNAHVADVLARANFGTLLFDLLTASEGASRANVFDIELLADRLSGAAAWAAAHPATADLPIGLFGASTGAAAALVAAADVPQRVAAVVSRGGRPDLAGTALVRVRAPTLLIVGSRDAEVLVLNRGALARLGGVRKLAVVPGATHLFEEPGALQVVADLATQWFRTYLTPPSGGTRHTAQGSPRRSLMKTMTKRALKTVAKVAAAKAMAAGARQAKAWAIAADAALVKAGEAARMRQRRRAKAAALKTAGRVALVAGAAAATLVTVRAVARNAKRGASLE